MFYALGQNFKIFLKILPRFLCLVVVMWLPLFFPEPGMAVWLFKILIVLLVARGWAKKMKEQRKLEFFEPSFISLGLYWIVIAGAILEKGEISNIFIFLTGIFCFAGMISGGKAISASFGILRKYDPTLKPLDIKFGSPDDYFENYSRAEDLERKISGLKEEAPPAVKRAIRQREAGKLIPFFHLEMIFLTMLVLEGTPWLK